MAREPEKSARETSKAKSETTAGSKNAGNDEAGEAKSGASDATELLKAQHQDFRPYSRSGLKLMRTAVRL